MALNYLTQATAFAFISPFNKTLVQADILEDWIAFCENRVNELLIYERIPVPTDDHVDLLKHATLLYLIDFLSQMQVISNSSGRVQETSLGNAKVRFARDNMFFFRSGDTGKPIDDLRESQTPHQMARSLVRTYKEWFYRNGTPETSLVKETVPIAVQYDNTSFGYLWNIDDDVVEDADDESEAYYP